MLGIQQTHSAAVHHPTTRSAASAAVAVSTGPLRTTPISKRRQSAVQKQQFSDTVSPTQDNQKTHAEAGAESNSAWPEVPRDGHGVDAQREDGANDKQGEINHEHNKPVSDGPDAHQAGSENEEQEKREGVEGNRTDVVDDYTRHPSSPLSELSPAPEDDDNPNQGDGGEGEGGEASTEGTSSQNTNVQPSAEGLSDPANLIALSSDRSLEANFIDGLPPSPPLTGTSSQFPNASSTPPTPSHGKLTTENAHAGPSGLASANTSRSDKFSKFSVLLELNAELFKVCQAFVAAGYVPQETPEAHPFSRKLENNLTWMSAHVDHSKYATNLPEMDPPALAPSAAHIAFPEGVFERIRSLYAQLPVVFAKDVARRNLLGSSSGAGTPTRNSSTPSLLPPSGIGVKRERPDSAGYARYESPTAPKRRDTGETKTFTSPSTPIQPGSAGVMGVSPQATPGFSPSHSQMARPSSSMGGVDHMSSGTQAPSSAEGTFSPNSNPGMGMSNSMQGIANMGNLSPEAQARARQIQMRQAQALMAQQQQQLHQQQQHGQPQISQQQQNLQHAGAHGGNVAIGSPQRQSQGSSSPTQQQQLMQAQAAAARQMSPPRSAGGIGMSMNGTENLSSTQQSGMSSNIPQTSMNTNFNGMGTNQGSNMTLNPQMMANMGPAAVAAYQVLQNAQHPMTLYLNQHIPGFSQLPMMEQMRRFQMLQQQRQMQQNQRNQQAMANQMMGGQMRPPNATASGSGASQMPHLGHGGQLGMAPQMQSSTSDGGMQLPGSSASANLPGRPATTMSMPQQMSGMTGMQGVPNLAGLNPQQRQLYLMQMQMRNSGAGGSGLGGGVGMNSSMINPQLLQERQRLEQQQRLALAQRHSSPLNPAANSGQFPPGLRSNPTASVGISRTGRSPSVASVGDMPGAATPRIGGRMLPGSEDYQRQVLLHQAQRNAQLQQQQGFMQGQGQVQGGWPGQQSPQLPLSAGAWPQQNQQGFGMGNSPPNVAMQGIDYMSPSRQTSATPAPMGHHSPVAPSSDFDNMMNW